MRGTELLRELSTATGLPDELIGEELSRLISGSGKSTDDVTLDELREMLGAYLQDVLLEAKDAFENDAEAHAAVQAAAAMIEEGPKADVIELDVQLDTKTTFAMFTSLGSSAPDFIGEG